ncbi:MAG: hypothetical protein JNJ65_11575 [Cyclobacteriaceae bacterium]|nr:hypothetical protein [Cyclobacteriaceae bacterium]
MKTSKQAGIWMDYSKAFVLEVNRDVITRQVIESDFTYEEKQHSYARNEGLMHKKEQRLEGEYFKAIMKAIQNYQEVVLLGPGDAKSELFNRITSNPHFKHVRISVEPADKLTDNQLVAFVKDYFHVATPTR